MAFIDRDIDRDSAERGLESTCALKSALAIGLGVEAEDECGAWVQAGLLVQVDACISEIPRGAKLFTQDFQSQAIIARRAQYGMVFGVYFRWTMDRRVRHGGGSDSFCFWDGIIRGRD